MDDPTSGDDPFWQRVKWTDEMVRLLIAAVASIGDDPNPLGKKGKWRTISALMAKRSFVISPQQCEDKFNDLSKRYKRLNEILGRGTSCDVVENPSLLDSMHHLSERSKRTVRKILGSKQLFYREMCAYHNGHRIPNAENMEGGRIAVIDKEEGKESEETEEGGAVVVKDGRSKGEDLVRTRMMQLEEERLEMEKERLDLKKQRMKWMQFKSKKEWELEKRGLENERMLLENGRMEILLKRKMTRLENKRMRNGEGGHGC